jgi:hypothetical protein
MQFPGILNDVSAYLGHLLSALGFLVFGLGAGRFVIERFKESAWQVQIALALGLFGVLVGVTDFASAGSAGAFALGAGAAYFMPAMMSSSGGEKKTS